MPFSTCCHTPPSKYTVPVETTFTRTFVYAFSFPRP
jgi:hypothetical protein